MQTMREAWTDERLDDLNKKMDEGFRRVDDQFKRVDDQFRRVDDRFTRVEQSIQEMRTEMHVRLDGLQRAMVHGVIAIAGFVSIFAAIVTQL